MHGNHKYELTKPDEINLISVMSKCQAFNFAYLTKNKKILKIVTMHSSLLASQHAFNKCSKIR